MLNATVPLLVCEEQHELVMGCPNPLSSVALQRHFLAFLTVLLSIVVAVGRQMLLFWQTLCLFENNKKGKIVSLGDSSHFDKDYLPCIQKVGSNCPGLSAGYCQQSSHIALIKS